MYLSSGVGERKIQRTTTTYRPLSTVVTTPLARGLGSHTCLSSVNERRNITTSVPSSHAKENGCTSSSLMMKHDVKELDFYASFKASIANSTLECLAYWMPPLTR